MIPPATHTQVEQNSGEEDRMDRLRNSSRSWDPEGISIYHSRSSLFLALMSVSQPPSSHLRLTTREEKMVPGRKQAVKQTKEEQRW